MCWYPMQCCGSELIFFRFGSKKNCIFFRIRIFILIFWPKFFLNGASHCFYTVPVCVLESVRQRSFPTEKLPYFFSFKCFICDFSQKKFILQQCLDPNPKFFSDSDPAKIFGVFQIRIHNTDAMCTVTKPAATSFFNSSQIQKICEIFEDFCGA
jgi:hypothetical protein